MMCDAGAHFGQAWCMLSLSREDYRASLVREGKWRYEVCCADDVLLADKTGKSSHGGLFTDGPMSLWKGRNGYQACAAFLKLIPMMRI